MITICSSRIILYFIIRTLDLAQQSFAFLHSSSQSELSKTRFLLEEPWRQVREVHLSPFPQPGARSTFTPPRKRMAPTEQEHRRQASGIREGGALEEAKGHVQCLNSNNPWISWTMKGLRTLSFSLYNPIFIFVLGIPSFRSPNLLSLWHLSHPYFPPGKLLPRLPLHFVSPALKLCREGRRYRIVKNVPPMRRNTSTSPHTHTKIPPLPFNFFIK